MRIVMLLVMALAAGCVSNSDYSRATPALSALAESIQLESTSQVHTLRWNPANCDCPEWEVKLSDRWLRVSVAAVGDFSMDQLEASKEKHEFEVEGPLSTSPYRCGATLLCGSLRITGLPTDTEPVP